MSSAKKHPYHLVQPSPWPVVGALSLFVLAIGAILAMHHQSSIVFFIGIAMLLFTMVAWWRDVIREAKSEHNDVVRHGFRLGMALFILSEVAFFAAFFWAYFDAALIPKEVNGMVWPPKSIHTLDPFDLPYLNTLLLLLSGTTVTWAHHAISEGKIQDMMRQTALTIALGVVFLMVQAYEYHHASFAFKGGIYPSVFYMATGFHGFHVFVGVLFLTVSWFRARAGHFTAKDHFGFEGAAWYWHFVDVVWLFLFVSIYWWGSGS
ncbi:MAG: cytochrome c oxidase subunit 3 [Proteobacteria bacterium]|nr:cytochrome c oxidase subunit 3 [Pseudomonadota bacterium]